MSDAASTRRSYDRVARRYAAEIGDELAAKPLDRALLDVLIELAVDGPVLDVGCGPGHVTRYLTERGASAVGLDLSPAMVAIAAGSVPAAVADMTAIPVASARVAGVVCFYALIHLDAAQRSAAYAEFARVLGPGGHALIAFHVSDEETPAGETREMTEWWDNEVDLTFRYLDPAEEVVALARVGLALVAQTDRRPMAGVEHASERCYLLVQRA